jgi:hypothetical protein
VIDEVEVTSVHVYLSEWRIPFTQHAVQRCAHVSVYAIARWELSDSPTTVPIANVIPKPIASVTAFGCADTTFRSLFLKDIF